jgi:hypothetical protein
VNVLSFRTRPSPNRQIEPDQFDKRSDAVCDQEAHVGVKYATFRNLEALWRPIGRIRRVRSEHSCDECDSHDENEHDNEADDGTP